MRDCLISSLPGSLVTKWITNPEHAARQDLDLLMSHEEGDGLARDWNSFRDSLVEADLHIGFRWSHIGTDVRMVDGSASRVFLWRTSGRTRNERGKGRPASPYS